MLDVCNLRSDNLVMFDGPLEGVDYCVAGHEDGALRNAFPEKIVTGLSCRGKMERGKSGR